MDGLDYSNFIIAPFSFIISRAPLDHNGDVPAWKAIGRANQIRWNPIFIIRWSRVASIKCTETVIIPKDKKLAVAHLYKLKQV